MTVDLVMDDWRKVGEPKSIYNTPLGVELSAGDLHSGTTFRAVVVFEQNVAWEIERAFKEHGAYPVFRFVPSMAIGVKGCDIERSYCLICRREIMTESGHICPSCTNAINERRQTPPERNA